MSPLRFETGRAMLMAGVRRRHLSESAALGLPAQWSEFRALGSLPGQLGSVTYGVMCGGSPQEFEYLCGAEVATFSGLPSTIGRMRIPVQRYAVFSHVDHTSSLYSSWAGILHDWLPASGFQSAHTPDFEVYGENFDPVTGLGGVEIWLGIA